MAIKRRESKCSKAAMIKVTVTVMGLALFGYIIGPPLYWHLTETLTAAVNKRRLSSCSPCVCDCSSQHSLLSVTQGLSNTTYSDCAKHDPEVSEEIEKNFSELLSEELELREAEALESQQRADMALLEAKKLTSQYQKEADKCNSGMETCEEAREKAEAALMEQRKTTAIWEQRARQKGWREGNAKFHSQAL